MKNRISTSILVISILFLIGCNNSEKKFKEAESLNTILAYHEFIKEFPESKFTALALTKIDSLKYENVLKKNSEDSFLEYSEKYPESKYANFSRAFAESLAYNRVKNENIESAYLDFIEKYPKSEYSTEIRKLSASLRFEDAINEYSVEGFKSFVSDYPESELVVSAKSYIDDIKHGRRYWSEDDFANKIKDIDENAFAESLWERTIITLKDGGHRITFNNKPEKRNGTIGFIGWPEKGIDKINLGQLVVFLYKEGIAPYGNAGIGELFFWRRSILVFYRDKSVSEEQMNELLEIHNFFVKYHLENPIESQISIVSVVAPI